MNQEFRNDREKDLVVQALVDAWGYPKSEKDQKQLNFSSSDIKRLLDQFLHENKNQLTDTEKQMILNCLEGALHYVDIDIPSLYSVSEDELKIFKESLEKKWNMSSTYHKK